MDYGTFVGLALNGRRMALRRTYYEALAYSLAAGDGEVPAEVAVAASDTPGEGRKLAFAINAERHRAAQGFQVALDPLQTPPSTGWPDPDEDAPVEWLPTRGAPAGPVVVQAPADDGPPPWAPPAGPQLVREIQKLVVAEGRAAAPAPAPARKGVAVYQPFGGRARG